MTPVQIIIAIAQLLPAIIAAMKAAEKALPAPGSGGDKLEVVRSVLSYGDKADELWPVAKPVVDTLVSVFNRAGWGD